MARGVAIARRREEIASCLQQVEADRARNAEIAALHQHLPAFDGIIAALSWILGSRETSPLGGETSSRAAADTIERERVLATSMMRREREVDRRGRGYVSGVEHALMWAIGDADYLP